MFIRKLTSRDFDPPDHSIRNKSDFTLGLNVMKSITPEKGYALTLAIKYCLETLGTNLLDALTYERITTVFDTTDDIQAELNNLAGEYNLDPNEFGNTTSGKSFRCLMCMRNNPGHFMFKIVIDNETLSDIELTQKIIFDHMNYLVTLVQRVKGGLRRSRSNYGISLN